MVKNLQILLVVLCAVTLVVISANAVRLSSIEVAPAAVTTAAQGAPRTSSSNQASANSILPSGVPDVYGEELGVSFDSVSASNPQLADATIRKLSVLDRQIELSGAELERYINILYTLDGGISCEYCCGAKAVIFENGKAACGCAHSAVMRGLTKYLISEHGNEYTDAEMLEEAAKWKALFFPTQTTQKAAVLEQQGIKVTFSNLGSNKYRGIGRGGGGMVGGC